MTFEYYQNRAGQAFENIIARYIRGYEIQDDPNYRLRCLEEIRFYRDDNFSEFMKEILPLILQNLGVTKFGYFEAYNDSKILSRFSSNEHEYAHIFYDKTNNLLAQLLYPDRYHLTVTNFSIGQTTTITAMINERCCDNIICYWLLNNIVSLHLVPDLLQVLVRVLIFDLEYVHPFALEKIDISSCWDLC